MNSPTIDPRRARLALWGLVAATAADSLGATMILPILPLFVRHAGASYAEVGVVTAVFWAAGLAVRYPVGKLSDRIGRKGPILVSQVIYAAATAAVAVSPSPVWFIILRAIQGAAAGAATVLALAAVADFIPPERRGRAYGSLTGANMAGTVVGPLIGAALFQVSVAATFLASAFTALVVAAVILATLPSVRPAAPGGEADRPRIALWRDPIIVGVTIASTAVGLLIGMYDTVWSLLMHVRHATDLEIGLSFTLFALPFTVGSWPAGWLADHMDNRWLIGTSCLASGCFAIVYPFLPSPAWLIGLGVFEGIFTVTGAPARLAMLSRQVHPSQMGRVQGLYGSAQVAAAALAAVVAGSLFGAGIALPFIATAVAMWVAAAALVPLWRGVDGHPMTSHPAVIEPGMPGNP
ncbi:MAG TPA: MFS transporter [Candidatus Dormibacteraeota bacterium]|nr:MFS transporter [Candidatus Dormibacteraeota bacterium]